MNTSEIIFESFINLLSLNFNNISIKRVNTEWYNKRKLRSCDFIVKIISNNTLLKCGVEIKSIGYDVYRKLKEEEKSVLKDTKGNTIATSSSFSCCPSKYLTKYINKSSQQLENVAKNKFPSILLLYPCPHMYNVVIDAEAIDDWMQYKEMNEGCLKDNPHINGIALLDIYAGRVLLHFYRNPYSTIPMGWEYNILFSDIKEYQLKGNNK